MSKKKWRRPAGVPIPPVVEAKKDKPDAEAKPAGDAALGANAARTGAARVDDAVMADAVAAADAEAPMPPRPAPFRRYDLNVSDDEAQGFINEMTRFLGLTVRRTNIIMGKVQLPGVQKVFAGDLPTDEVAVDIEQVKKALPRSHPLIALIRFAMAASRLLHRILMTTKPHLFGRPSNAYKNIVHAAQASEKFLKGRVPPEAMRDAIGRSGLSGA
jgi:hypothetical protein